MQKNKQTIICIATLLALLSPHCFAQDSVQTVQALLDAENKAIIDKLKAISDAMSPPKPPVEKKAAVKKGPASFNVGSVYGPTNNIKTDVVYEGKSFTGIAPGAQVGPCKVSQIRGVCVSLIASSVDPIGSVPGLSEGEIVLKKSASVVSGGVSQKASPKTSKTKQAKDSNLTSSAQSCPTACWSPPAPVIPANMGGTLGVFPLPGQAPRFAPPVMIGNQPAPSAMVPAGVIPPSSPSALLPGIKSAPVSSPVAQPVVGGELKMSTTLSSVKN